MIYLGSVVERYLYDPYGTVSVYDANWNYRPNGSAYGWVYLFQGGRYEATGLYHFGARDLSPTLGRWVEQDPIGFGGWDANWYGFVGEDPTSRTDPTGLQQNPQQTFPDNGRNNIYNQIQRERLRGIPKQRYRPPTAEEKDQLERALCTTLVNLKEALKLLEDDDRYKKVLEFCKKGYKSEIPGIPPRFKDLPVLKEIGTPAGRQKWIDRIKEVISAIEQGQYAFTMDYDFDTGNETAMYTWFPFGLRGSDKTEGLPILSSFPRGFVRAS